MPSEAEIAHCQEMELQTVDRPFAQMLMDQRAAARVDVKDAVLALLHRYDEFDVVPVTAEVLIHFLTEAINAEGFGEP